MRKKGLVNRLTDCLDIDFGPESANDPEQTNEDPPDSPDAGSQVFKLDSDGRTTLPDGTPVVEPVPVESRPCKTVKPVFKRQSISQKATKVLSPGIPDVVKCTACATKLYVAYSNLKVHPVLQVIMCRRCLRFYMRQKFMKDAAGKEEICRWCADGGDLICCDHCSNAFCRRCIKRNLGRSKLVDIESLDSTQLWKCIVCDPALIEKLTTECSTVTSLGKDYREARAHRKDHRHQTNRTQSEPIDNAEPALPTVVSSSSSSSATSLNSPTITAPVNFDVLTSLLSHFGPTNLPAPSISTPAPIPPPDLTNLLNFFNTPLNLPVTCMSFSTILSTNTMNPVPSHAFNSLPAPRNLVTWSSLPTNPTLVAAPFSDLTSPSTQDDDGLEAVIIQQINKVDESNIRFALKATRRCIETFSSDLRLLEGKIIKASKPAEMAEIIQSFQNLYRFHLFTRFANLSTRIHEMMPRVIDGVQMSRRLIKPAYIPVFEKSPLTIDLTDESANLVQTNHMERQLAPWFNRISVPANKGRTTPNNKRIPDSSSKQPIMKRQKCDSDANATCQTSLSQPQQLNDVGSGISNDPIIIPISDSPDKVNHTEPQNSPSKSASLVQPTGSTPTKSPLPVPHLDGNNTHKDKTPLSLRESSVYLEDISQKLGDTSVLHLNETTVHGYSPKGVDSTNMSDSLTDQCMAEDTSDDEMSNLSTEVTALERTCMSAISQQQKTEGSTYKKQRSSLIKSHKKPRKSSDAEWSSEEGSIGSEKESILNFNDTVETELMGQTDKDLDNHKELVHSHSFAENEEEDQTDSGKVEVNKPVTKVPLSKFIKDSKRDRKKPNYSNEFRELMKPLSEEQDAKKAAKKSEGVVVDDIIELTSDSDDVCKPASRRKTARTARPLPSSSDEEGQSESESSEEISEPVSNRARKSLNRRSRTGTKKKRNESESMVDSDSSFEIKRRSKSSLKATVNESSDESDASNSEKVDKNKSNPSKKPKRRLQSRPSDTEVDGENPNESDLNTSLEEETKGRKEIRKIYSKSKLSETTKTAEAEERERRRRISERQKVYNDSVLQEGTGIDMITKMLVLEKDAENTPLIAVHADILKHLKPHQVEAVRFMWDCVIESVEENKKTNRSDERSNGCILAHCMGLGKTLSVIAFIHTLLTHTELLEIHRCLVICPVNTLLNWKHEWDMWLPEMSQLDVFEIATKTDPKLRLDIMKHWMNSGGIFLLGYDMFRNFVTPRGKNGRQKKMKELVRQALLDPGPDIVVCDEGHVLKNDNSILSKAVSEIRTKRRIVLTGTPLQNNLIEYHAMVNFVKRNLLGTAREFSNRFSNPIRNGQHLNSTASDVNVMKKRAHVLYKMLDGCVQRKDYNALTKYLPPRYEYILMCRLSEVQCNLYRSYLQVRADRAEALPKELERRKTIFSDQQTLYRVWTHPYLLRSHESREARKLLLNENEFIDDDFELDESDTTESDGNKEGDEDAKTSAESSDSDDLELIEPSSSNTSTFKKPIHHHHTRANKFSRNSAGSETDEDMGFTEDGDSLGLASKSVKPWWYSQYEDEFDWSIEVGGKTDILFRLLKKCGDIGDKVLIFTQSLLSLDLLERFLGELNRQWMVSQCEMTNDLPNGETFQRPDLSKYFSDIGINTWVRGMDYERMDGSMNAVTRRGLQNRFNRISNSRLRLFLISTKAGGLGINLVAANRLILFDASWNPTHDIQSIFRSYRFGQNKSVSIYRLIAQGTMEEKIYDRQVIKQSLSLRVIDEQQIDRHFTDDDLQALYTFDPDVWDPAEADKRPTPKLPKDRLLADMLLEYPHLLSKFHEHDSLIEHREDEGLTEDQRQEAWREYEQEKTLGMSLARYQRQQEIANQQMTAMRAMQQQHQQRLYQQSLYGNPSFANFVHPSLAPIYPKTTSGTISHPYTSANPITSPSMGGFGNFMYPQLFEKYRAHVLQTRPNLASDPVQLEQIVFSHIMDLMARPLQQSGAPNNIRNNFSSNSINRQPKDS